MPGIFQMRALSRLNDGEVDPPAVSGKAGKTSVEQIRRQVCRLAASRRHDQHVGPRPGITVERDRLAVGRPAWKPGKTAIDVTCTAFDPSGADTQISDSPERFDRNATRCPSGERLGIPSNRVEPIAGTGGEEAGAPAAAVSTRQILPSAKLRT